MMAGLRIKTGSALPSLAFCFPRRGETLSGSEPFAGGAGQGGISFFKNTTLVGIWSTAQSKQGLYTQIAF